MRITAKQWLNLKSDHFSDIDEPEIKTRKKRTYPEYEEQCKVMHWFRELKRIKKIPEHYLMYPNRNTQKLTLYQQGREKQAGLEPGIPDLFLAVANGYAGLFIEMKEPDKKPLKEISCVEIEEMFNIIQRDGELPKRTRKGGLSEQQIVKIQMLRKCGYKVVICYSANDAIKEITNYLGLQI